MAAARDTARKDDYDNPAKALALVQRCRDDAARNTPRLERDKQDLLNLLTWRGGADNHWVSYDPHSNTWVRKPYDGPDGIPDWVPRATTNVFRRKVDGIVAILNQASPGKVFVPATDDDQDLAAAKVCEDALPVLEQEIDYDSLKRQINQQIALTDKVAIVYWYDPDEKYGTDAIPALQCTNPECAQLTTPMDLEAADPTPLQAVETPDLETQALAAEEPAEAPTAPPIAPPDPSSGTCPHCGAPLALAQDPRTGQTIGVDYPIGRICAEVVSSFEFSLPRSARVPDADKCPWVLLHNQWDKYDAFRLWPDFRDAIEQAASEDSRSGMQRQFARNMRALSAPRVGGQMTRTSDTEGLGPVIYRLQHDPISDEEFHFPDGLYAVVCGDMVLESGPLPVADAQTGRRRKSILIRTFADAPGTPYGAPPADDLVPLQHQRNLAETLLFMILLHHAAPAIFIPLSVTMEDEVTGIPGAIYRYRSVIPGEKPSRDQGINPPEGLYKFLELIDAKFEEISGLNSVLQGARPQGDPTLGEVQILQERGMAAFRTPLDHLIAFEKKQALLLLDLARQSAWSPRFRQIEGENGGWNVTQFAGTDLKGSVDVWIEPTSAWPKSPMLEQLRIQKAVGLGLIVPPQDPEVSAKLLVKMGLEDCKPSLDVDRQQVARKLDAWKAATDPGQIAPPNPTVDNLQLHAHLLKNWLKGEEAEQLATLNAPLYAAMVGHVQQIEGALAMQQMQAALAQAGPGAGPGGPQESAGPDGSVMQAAVESGALVPAGARPSPMNDLTATGALVPAGMQQGTGVSVDQLLEQGALTPVLPEPVGAPR